MGPSDNDIDQLKSVIFAFAFVFGHQTVKKGNCNLEDAVFSTHVGDWSSD
jgi:hypothetical protein